MRLPPGKFPINSLEQPLPGPRPLWSGLFSETQSELVCCLHRGAEGTGLGLEFLSPEVPPGHPGHVSKASDSDPQTLGTGLFL